MKFIAALYRVEPRKWYPKHRGGPVTTNEQICLELMDWHASRLNDWSLQGRIDELLRDRHGEFKVKVWQEREVVMEEVFRV